MEDCKEVDKILQAETCKNLFLCNRQMTDFYLLLIPGNKVFQTKELSAQIGSSRLSFASADYMQKLLDVTPGSVTVLGLMNDKEKKIHLLVDEDVLIEPSFGCHPCINTSTLHFSTKDLLEKVIPTLEHPMQLVHLSDENE